MALKVESRETRLKKKRKRIANAKEVDMRFMGQEPEIDEVNEHNQPEYSKALSWYNYFFDYKDAKKEILEYVKEKYPADIFKKINKLKDHQCITTAAWIIKMKGNGTVFYEKAERYLDDTIYRMAESVPTKEETEEAQPVKALSPYDRVQRRASATLCSIEEEIDKFIESDYKSDSFKMYEFLLKENPSPNCLNALHKQFSSLIKEMEEYPEDFKYLKRRAKRLLEFYQKCLDDINRMRGNKKVERKPRAVKSVPVDKKVSNFKYQAKDDPMKLVSEKPQNIIGAKEIWIYNTKFRNLTRILSDHEKGFDIQGSSIIGLTSGIIKKLRKPEESLAAFFKQGKVGRQTFLDTIGSKEYVVEPNKPYRSNSETMIIKVIK